MSNPAPSPDLQVSVTLSVQDIQSIVDCVDSACKSAPSALAAAQALLPVVYKLNDAVVRASTPAPAPEATSEQAVS